MWTAAAENIATMPSGYPILFYGYGNGNNPKAYNNTALYGDFVASTVTNLFLQAGPTSSPGGNLPMQGLESCQSSSMHCPDECDAATNQCPTWVRRNTIQPLRVATKTVEKYLKILFGYFCWTTTINKCLESLANRSL